MLQKYSLWKVASVFFENPEKYFELVKISAQINLAHTSVKNHLNTLIKLDLIKLEKGPGERYYYVSNKRNKLFIHYKKIYNLDKLIHSQLIEYLVEKVQPNSIVLFGSYLKGEDSIESDIDLFVESSNADLNLELYERKLNRKIEIHFKNNFKKYPAELKNNILNGNVVYGFLEGYDA